MATCEACRYCKYPRTSDDNRGACKCKLMHIKPLMFMSAAGQAPQWCPLNKLTAPKGNKND